MAKRKPARGDNSRVFHHKRNLQRIRAIIGIDDELEATIDMLENCHASVLHIVNRYLPDIEADQEINGGDVVEWLGEFIPDCQKILEGRKP